MQIRFKLLGATAKAVSPRIGFQKLNKDRYAIRQTSKGSVAVLCDGCSACPASRKGAAFTAPTLTALVAEELDQHGSVRLINWAHMELQLAQAIRNEIQRDHLGEDLDQVIWNGWLFTIIVLVIDMNGDAVVAWIGDGMIGINNDVGMIPVPIANTPPFFCYGMLQKIRVVYNDPASGLQRLLSFRRKILAAHEIVAGLFIASDGYEGLFTDDLANELYTLVRRATSPLALMRRLHVLVRGYKSSESWRLRDDMTAVVAVPITK